MKSKTVQIPLYGGKIVVYQVSDLKAIQEKHDLTDVEGCDALSFQINSKQGVGVFYLAFEGKPNPSIIAHEAVHITNMILKHIYAKLDIENDEPQAYLLGWIVEQCHKFLEVKNEK